MSAIKVQGKFTAKESELLSENVSSLLTQHDLDEADICNALNDGERKKIRKNHPFWTDLCEKFPRRQYKSIYQAVQRFLVAENSKKLASEGTSVKWDDETMTKLNALHEKHGSRWADIGRELQRTGDSCKKAYERKFGNKIKDRHIGKFSPEEDQQIVDGMLKLVGVNSIAETQGKKLLWTNLAKDLGKGRSPDDYRRHWQRKIVPNQFKNTTTPMATSAGATSSASTPGSLVQAVPVNSSGIAPAGGATMSAAVSADRDGRREAKSQTRANLLVALHSSLIGPVPGIGAPPGGGAHNINFARRDSDAWNTLQADCVDWAAMVYHEGVACARPRVEWDTLLKQAKKKENKTGEPNLVLTSPLDGLSFVGQIEKLCNLHSADIRSLRESNAQVAPARLRSPALAFLADNLNGDSAPTSSTRAPIASSTSSGSSTSSSSSSNNAVLSIPAVVPSNMMPVTVPAIVPQAHAAVMPVARGGGPPPVVDYISDSELKRKNNSSEKKDSKDMPKAKRVKR